MNAAIGLFVFDDINQNHTCVLMVGGNFEPWLRSVEGFPVICRSSIGRNRRQLS